MAHTNRDEYAHAHSHKNQFFEYRSLNSSAETTNSSTQMANSGLATTREIDPRFR